MSLPVVKIMNQSLLRWERGFGSQLARLAIPIAIQSVVTSSMQIIDNVMIGYLGDIPLAAVTQANRISFLFQVTMFGVISGASSSSPSTGAGAIWRASGARWALPPSRQF